MRVNQNKPKSKDYFADFVKFQEQVTVWVDAKGCKVMSSLEPYMFVQFTHREYNLETFGDLLVSTLKEIHDNMGFKPNSTFLED